MAISTGKSRKQHYLIMKGKNGNFIYVIYNIYTIY